MHSSKLKGSRMKLNPLSAAAPVAQPQADLVSSTARQGAAAAAVVAPDVTVGAQAARVQAAQAQLAGMPEVDLQRVQDIRQALARGEISFDPAKLAALVQRHHGGRG